MTRSSAPAGPSAVPPAAVPAAVPPDRRSDGAGASLRPAAPGGTGESGAFGWIDALAATRRATGLVRTLRPRAADGPALDLAGNDYLGLTREPRVSAGAARAAARWGAGSTGSRLVTGSTELHAALERALAAFCGFEAALVLASGYAANLAAVTALGVDGGLVVSDAGNHASLIDGCRLSRARTAVVPHRDLDAVREALGGRGGPALAVTDAVFSVDGDAAALGGLAGVCRAAGAGMLVDDAHGFGVLGDGGRGTVAAAGLAGADDVVCTVTLSKSLGAQGGAVLGPARVIEHLVNAARTCIFDTALAPAAVGGALAALEVLGGEPDRPARALAAARALYEGLTAARLRVAEPDACVLSVRAPGPRAAVRWAADCRAAGLVVGCFRPPSVPDGVSRLRLTARADLSEEQIARAVEVIVRTAPSG